VYPKNIILKAIYVYKGNSQCYKILPERNGKAKELEHGKWLR